VTDVIVIGGGFAGVTAARELAQAGLDALLVEARDRLGGRTWRSTWNGLEIELGGGYVHWHQPHVFAELTRAGQRVERAPRAELVSWTVDGLMVRGSQDERDDIARRGWDRFVAGAGAALPYPHAPLRAADALAAFDRESCAARLARLDLPAHERDVLAAELESVVSAPLDEASAATVARWHALSGGSLDLTQDTGGGYVFADGTAALLASIADGAPFERRLSAPVAAIEQRGGEAEVRLRGGEALRARAVVCAVPLNVLPDLRFAPGLSSGKQAAIALGQASRGSKTFIRVRGETRPLNAISPGHPFGYTSTYAHLDDGSQVLVTFGAVAEGLDMTDLDAVEAALHSFVFGGGDIEVVDATWHDWARDEFTRGTWAAHRPGWFADGHHAAMRSPDGRVVFAGSDLADGWSGFVDGAIESGLRAARDVRARLAG
jgi:pseudooxynicotine dehydrogenase